MLFTWDENKNTENKRKHGISFETAELVFDDPFHVSRQDRIENGEERWQTVGFVADMMLLLVAHTWEDQEGQEHVRIISARMATRIERKSYEQDF